MEKHCDEKLLYLMGPWVVAKVENTEDSKEVQTMLSLPPDSPMLLMMEEEYRDTLWEGEKWGLEAP